MTTTTTTTTPSRTAVCDDGRIAARRIVILAGRVALAAIAGVLLIAIVTHIAFADPAQQRLGYRFPGVPATAGTAARIFINNVAALVLLLGLLLLTPATAHHPRSRLVRAAQRCGEIVLAAEIALNTLVLGASLGAYGPRMLVAILPHGPVELAAYSLALALYLHGRRHPLPARQIAATIATSITLLAIAAVLETFVTL